MKRNTARTRVAQKYGYAVYICFLSEEGGGNKDLAVASHLRSPVPNKPYGFCGRKAAEKNKAEGKGLIKNLAG